ncbi:Adhesion G Protein-Coupled Receptor A2 [Manis pentadactyla]|nr:Adhesion G Protein-Coupled Receptor A2 [Manis pentadactyla]
MCLLGEVGQNTPEIPREVNKVQTYTSPLNCKFPEEGGPPGVAAGSREDRSNKHEEEQNKKKATHSFDDIPTLLQHP